MEKKIITDKERIAALKERRAVLNDKVKFLETELQKYKKELKSEQFVSAKLRAVIYGSIADPKDILELMTMVRWLVDTTRENDLLRDYIERKGYRDLNEYLNEYKGILLSNVEFKESGQPDKPKTGISIEYVYSEN